MAGLMDVLSNNSELTLTLEQLRNLATTKVSREAGSEPPLFKVHRLTARLQTHEISVIIRRYESGDSATSLAKEFEIAPSALLRLLREQNVVVRRQLVTAELEASMALDYEAGMTMAELEEKHGLSHGAVMRALHRSGVEMRARVPRKKSIRA